MKITARLLDNFYNPPTVSMMRHQWVFKPIKDIPLTPVLRLDFYAFSRSFRARRNWQDIEDAQVIELLKARLPPEAIVECVRAAIEADDIPF